MLGPFRPSPALWRWSSSTWPKQSPGIPTRGPTQPLSRAWTMARTDAGMTVPRLLGSPTYLRSTARSLLDGPRLALLLAAGTARLPVTAAGDEVVDPAVVDW